MLERRVAQAHGAALADSQQSERIKGVLFEYEFNTASQVAIDVGVEAREAVGAVGIAPVEQIHIEPRQQQFADEGAVRL